MTRGSAPLRLFPRHTCCSDHTAQLRHPAQRTPGPAVNLTYNRLNPSRVARDAALDAVRHERRHGSPQAISEIAKFATAANSESGRRREGGAIPRTRTTPETARVSRRHLGRAMGVTMVWAWARTRSPSLMHRWRVASQGQGNLRSPDMDG